MGLRAAPQAAHGGPAALRAGWFDSISTVAGLADPGVSLPQSDGGRIKGNGSADLNDFGAERSSG